VCFVLWWAAVKGSDLEYSPLLWPVAGFGIFVALQWLLRLTSYPGATLTGLCQLAAAGAIFYLAVTAFGDWRNVRRFGVLAWVLCGGLGALAIVQFFTSNKKIYWYHNADYASPVGPFVYHNHFAGAMDLLLPVAIAVAFKRDRTGDSPWVGWVRRGILPALGFVSVVLSYSRGGMLTLAFEALIAVVLLTRSKRVMIPLAVGAMVFIGFGALVDWTPILERFANLGHHDPSWYERLTVSGTCLRIFRDHLLAGTGFSTFSTVYPRYQTFDNGLIWDYAHNEYAQMLAETGIAGLIAVVAFIVLLVRNGWPRAAGERGDRGLKASSTQRVRTAAFIGCLGLLFHSFGDFQFHAPAIAFLFFVMAAAATARVDGVVRRRILDTTPIHLHRETEVTESA
jgi:hypothetical protein